MKTYREKMKTYHPAALPKYIEWQKVMAVWEVSDEMGALRIRSGFGSILRALREAFVDTVIYHQTGNETAQCLLFYGAYNYRKDHYRTFTNFASSLENVRAMAAEPCKKRWHILRGIKLTGLNFVWIVQALLKGCNPVQAANTAHPLTLCYVMRNGLEKELNAHPKKLFIAYFDASPDESFAVQVARHYGLVTATLQHGIFASKQPRKMLSDTAFEYSDSVSDYYLAWNEYTKDEWKKVASETQKIKVLGIPKFSGAEEIKRPEKVKKNVFGIMLNNSSFPEHNKRLIQMANEIAKRSGIKYVLRYHPELKKDAYQEYIDKEFCMGKSDNGMTIQEYADTVDFTVISSSSVFIDLLYLGYPVYRLKVFESDTYSNVAFNAFSRADELTEMLQSARGNEEVFDYMCTTRRVKKAYQDFIDEMVKDRK